MKKILFVTPFYLPRLGGVEYHTEQVSQHLISRDNQVTVLTRKHAPDLPDEEVVNGVRVIRMKIKKNESFFGRENTIITKLNTWTAVLQQQHFFLEADIIHVHDVMWWLIFIYPFIPFKVYATFHGWEGIYPVPFKNKCVRWFSSGMARKRIHIGAWIQEFYWDVPDMVLYGGVDSRFFLGSQSESSSFEKTARLISKTKYINLVFVGRLESENNIKQYISLIRTLKKDFKVKATWVGDGSFRSECEQVGEVTGMVDDTATYICQADIVFAASYLSILQAQALGKVVVSMFSHSLKQRYLETYPGSKHMITGSDCNTVAQQVGYLIEKPAEKRKKEKKASQFAQGQTWSKVADSYIQLWGKK